MSKKIVVLSIVCVMFLFSAIVWSQDSSTKTTHKHHKKTATVKSDAATTATNAVTTATEEKKESATEKKVEGAK